MRVFSSGQMLSFLPDVFNIIYLNVIYICSSIIKLMFVVSLKDSNHYRTTLRLGGYNIIHLRVNYRDMFIVYSVQWATDEQWGIAYMRHLKCLLAEPNAPNFPVQLPRVKVMIAAVRFRQVTVL